MVFTLLFYAYALLGAPWFRGSLRRGPSALLPMYRLHRLLGCNDGDRAERGLAIGLEKPSHRTIATGLVPKRYIRNTTMNRGRLSGDLIMGEETGESSQAKLSHLLVSTRSVGTRR